MAVFRKIGELPQKLLWRNVQFISVARKSTKSFGPHDDEVPHLKGLIPDPYPKTEEEWKRSAEKYNLHPDEYKPYNPHSSDYTGDYPELPWLGVETRSPYYPWDYPSVRRNYGEPLHKEFDMMGEDRYDYGVRRLINDYKASAIFFAFFGSFFVLYALLPETSQPLMEKQYPGKGEHYTFELIK